MNPDFNDLGLGTPPEDLDVLRQLCVIQRERLAPHRKIEAVEVGTWAGRTALLMADHFDRVYCVDHWQGNPCDYLATQAAVHPPIEAFQTFCRNMGDRLYRSVIPCFGESHHYASIWPRKVSLVFIDADHRYFHVKRDIISWLPHVLPGGIICGHDYCLGRDFEGVIQAVNEAFGPDQFQVSSRVWWHQVK